MATFHLDTMQAALRERDIEGWLFYDHHGRDSLAYHLLGLPAAAHVTRRWYYFVPAQGAPRKLVHRIESGKLDTLPGARAVYSSWQELEQQLAILLSGSTRIAMQYSPRNAIMYISMVDAGTVELLRDLGKQIVTSADLVSQFQAVLTQAQMDSHLEAQRAIDSILDAAWSWMRGELNSGRALTEYAAQSWLVNALDREQLDWQHRPNVSVNANSADSHYEPAADGSVPIQDGDFLLIDIWGRRRNDPQSVFYDITWTATVGRPPSQQEQSVFAAVREARDAAIALVTAAFEQGQPIAGWQPDAAARRVLSQAGYGAAFTHRTGHNIGTELHGPGAHLDDFESHDERLILPNTCFSVEPGVYLDTFGIRSEVNMLTHKDKAFVTGRVQQQLVRV